MSESGEMAIVEYLINQYQGIKINQKNINAYLSKDGIWVDVHLSKTSYQSVNKKLFDDILISIKFNEKYVPSRLDYFEYASNYSMNQDYENAIIFYQKLLDLEIKEPTIYKQNLWYVLIDNLGMSYGISGKLEKAKEIFEYGLKQDDKYPMFYYNLACVYAEMNNLDDMLINLETAIKYKNNILEGEKFPDPKKDDSFKKYLDDKKFKELVEKL